MKFVQRKSILAIFSIVAILMLSLSSVSALLTTGELVTMGSSTVLPISNAMETDWEAWMLSEHGITIDAIISGGGSGVGVGSVVQTPRTADVGAASREPKSGEWSQNANLQIYGIGLDSLAVIVGDGIAGAGLQNLTAAQAATLFVKVSEGGYTTWEDANTGLSLGLTLSGGPHAIDRIRRPLESGTHDAFKKFILGEGGFDDADLAEGIVEIENNGEVVDAMTQASGDWTIAYIGLGFLSNPALNGIWLYNDVLMDYIQPTAANALGGSYPPIRWLYYMTDGTPELEEHLWISFCMKDAYENGDASYIVADGGYINKYRGDMAGRASADPLAPVHPELPDNTLNYKDLFAFVGAYIDYFQSGTLNPFCDFNANGDINYQDLFAFIGEYIAFFS